MKNTDRICAICGHATGSDVELTWRGRVCLACYDSAPRRRVVRPTQAIESRKDNDYEKSKGHIADTSQKRRES